MKIISRQEEGAAVAAPEEAVRNAATLGGVALITITVAAAKDVYSNSKELVKWAWDKTVGRFFADK